ncbi:MAG: family 43 glycosylhydrolase [Nocardioides sp.]|uniref:family 43 glycosylhydrolase n=1 Tax=Nocardioides sp. TaxID=35761 RepID=UPI0039E57602
MTPECPNPSTRTSLPPNPILPGFHPDPSLIQVGDVYVLANSTFEWWPGIALHTSVDLQSWAPAGYVFTDPGDLDLRDVPDSGGLWAPSLSHDGSRYWLVVGAVHTWSGPFKDIDVFLTTASDLEGPWTKPVRLGGGGFDPSIFHDEDGRHWLLNMRWDHRPDNFSFAGVTLQEINETDVVGEERLILTSEELLEGPNLYVHDGWFHLMLAEGGTGWNHGIRTGRSRFIEGPYDLDPEPLLTTRDNWQWPLQKAGHGELVRGPNGEWVLVHLASRPLLSTTGPVCVLGRETCLQEVEWIDGRLRLIGGGHWPARASALDQPLPYPSGFEDTFDGDALDPRWLTLREPADPSWVDLSTRPGWLRLRGRRSVFASVGVSLIATRLLSTHCAIATKLAVKPRLHAQRAGLGLWYDRRGHHLVTVTCYDGRAELVVSSTDGDRYHETRSGILVDEWPSVHLRASIDGLVLRFEASPDGDGWRHVGKPLDMASLSDDWGGALRFTGTMIVLFAEDTGPGTMSAEFAGVSVISQTDDPSAKAPS